MKIIKVRYKRNIRQRVSMAQKPYHFICPLKDIKVGEYVLVEKNYGMGMQMARVEAVYENEKQVDYKKLITGTVFCKIHVKDVEERSDFCLQFLTKWLKSKNMMSSQAYIKNMRYLKEREAKSKEIKEMEIQKKLNALREFY